jgi:hypothetical protein
MALADLAYPTLVYLHLLLFVFWFGADAGVFLLGQHFRKRHAYTLDQRIALLKLLVVVDLVPRMSWALMVPVSLSVSKAGKWWDIHPIGLGLAWVIGGIWVWLILDAHRHDQTDRAARDRRNENFLKILLTLFYLWLGIQSLLTGEPFAPTWLALKAFAFGLIFLAAIMIDVSFKPVGPQLVQLLKEGSSDATEIPLRRTMDRTRIWVWAVYALLIVTSFLGAVKPL